MYNWDDFVKLIKKAAVEAVNASNPADIAFGKVVSEVPLKIKVDQKLILTEKQLVLTRNVTNHEIEMQVENQVRKKYLVYNALKNDEKVILMQMAGGQRYVVIDRIGKG